MFLMGRCCEASRSAAIKPEDRRAEAVKWYRDAIENHTPEPIEAYKRLATLLRGQLKQPAEADKVIDEMVRSAPKNYLVYLVRGRYLRDVGLPASEADFKRRWSLAQGLA